MQEVFLLTGSNAGSLPLRADAVPSGELFPTSMALPVEVVTSVIPYPRLT